MFGAVCPAFIAHYCSSSIPETDSSMKVLIATHVHTATHTKCLEWLQLFNENNSASVHTSKITDKFRTLSVKTYLLTRLIYIINSLLMHSKPDFAETHSNYLIIKEINTGAW